MTETRREEVARLIDPGVFAEIDARASLALKLRPLVIRRRDSGLAKADQILALLSAPDNGGKDLEAIPGDHDPGAGSALEGVLRVNDWAPLADEVLAAVATKVAPFLKRATDDLYEQLLYATQEYLSDNAQFNISSTIEAARRDAVNMRQVILRHHETLLDTREHGGLTKFGEGSLAEIESCMRELHVYVPGVGYFGRTAAQPPIQQTEAIGPGLTPESDPTGVK